MLTHRRLELLSNYRGVKAEIAFTRIIKTFKKIIQSTVFYLAYTDGGWESFHAFRAALRQFKCWRLTDAANIALGPVFRVSLINVGLTRRK